MIPSGVVLVQFGFLSQGGPVFIYSLFDRKVREYGQLVLGSNDATIIRGLVESLSRTGKNTVEKYPEDFDLMCVGEFNCETGELGPVLPRLVDNVDNLLDKE